MGLIYKCDKCGKECTEHYIEYYEDIWINEFSEKNKNGIHKSLIDESLILCPYCFNSIKPEFDPDKRINFNSPNPLGTWEPKEEEE